MGWVAGALTLVGTAMDASGSYYEGKAANAAAKFNAGELETQGRAQAEFSRLLSRRVRAANVTRVAKSGVRPEGSALDVIAENAFRAEKEAQNAFRAARTAATLQRLEGRNALSASRTKLTASLMRGVGSFVPNSDVLFSQVGLNGQTTTSNPAPKAQS